MAKRILHVFGIMDRGGAEIWVMNLLRHLDRNEYQFDFLVHTNDSGEFDEEILSRGSLIFHCTEPRRPFKYSKKMMKILKEKGPYDAVHSHVHQYSGWILRTASKAGIKHRIAHSHSDTTSLKKKANLLRKLYLVFTSYLISKHATCGLACSEQAAISLYGAEWNKKPNYKVLPYGLDFSSYETSIDKDSIRRSLEIAENSIVVGHVGRFVESKNHQFILAVAKELFKKENEITFVFVGDGPKYVSIRDMVYRDNILNKHLVFLGTRSDVPDILRAAIDVFIFPSSYEGFGIAVVEAQAAGVPCLISSTIPNEVDIGVGLVKRMSLQEPASSWATELKRLISKTANLKKSEYLKYARASQFSIASNIKEIKEIYGRA